MSDLPTFGSVSGIAPSPQTLNSSHGTDKGKRAHNPYAAQALPRSNTGSPETLTVHTPQGALRGPGKSPSTASDLARAVNAVAAAAVTHRSGDGASAGGRRQAAPASHVEDDQSVAGSEEDDGLGAGHLPEAAVAGEEQEAAHAAPPIAGISGPEPPMPTIPAHGRAPHRAETYGVSQLSPGIKFSLTHLMDTPNTLDASERAPFAQAARWHPSPSFPLAGLHHSPGITKSPQYLQAQRTPSALTAYTRAGGAATAATAQEGSAPRGMNTRDGGSARRSETAAGASFSQHESHGRSQPSSDAAGATPHAAPSLSALPFEQQVAHNAAIAAVVPSKDGDTLSHDFATRSDGAESGGVVSAEALSRLVDAAHPRDVACPPGFTLTVYNGDISQHFVLPSEAVQVTRGSIKYVDHHARYGAQMRFRFQLCHNYLLHKCPKLSECSYIHATKLPPPSQVHLNPFAPRRLAADRHGRSAEVPYAEVDDPAIANQYETMPAGATFVVFPPHGNQVTSQETSVPSHMVIRTRGAEEAWTFMLDPRQAPAGYRPRHCAHYQFKRVCNQGVRCALIHSKVPFAGTVVGLPPNAPGVTGAPPVGAVVHDPGRKPVPLDFECGHDGLVRPKIKQLPGATGGGVTPGNTTGHAAGGSTMQQQAAARGVVVPTLNVPGVVPTLATPQVTPPGPPVAPPPMMHQPNNAAPLLFSQLAHTIPHTQPHLPQLQQHLAHQPQQQALQHPPHQYFNPPMPAQQQSYAPSPYVAPYYATQPYPPELTHGYAQAQRPSQQHAAPLNHFSQHGFTHQPQMATFAPASGHALPSPQHLHQHQHQPPRPQHSGYVAPQAYAAAHNVFVGHR